MASVKIILRKDRINAKNEHPLWIRVSKDRKSKYITLDIYLLPAQWDDKLQRVKKNHPNKNQLNAFLASKVSEAEGVSVELETKSKYIGTYNIKEAIIGKALPDFFPYADKFVNHLEASGKIGTYRRAKAVIAKLRKFAGDKPLLFDQITVSFLKEYENHLKANLKNRQNTVHANFRLMRTIMNNAVREDLLPVQFNAFNKYKLKAEQTQRAYLTEAELSKMEVLQLKEGSVMNHHRNIYVFAAYTGGLRISDVLQLRWKNFDGEKINIMIHKTQTPLSIKLPERALQIISEYRIGECKGNDFIFPLLKVSPDEENPKVIFNAISSATAYTNTDLKKLGTAAKIEKHISFHTSRHTWATRALTKGMRIEHVSKLMGHAAIKETQIYAKIVNGELDKAMAVFN